MTASTGAAAAAAAMAQAAKAMGTIVNVDAETFLLIVNLNDEPLVVHAPWKQWFSRKEQYMTSYRGLAFYCRPPDALTLPGHCQLIEAEKMWVPG